MVNRLAIEAFSRTMQDIMNNVIENSLGMPFGGKTLVLGCDFRKILPVVPKGGRADVVYATINSSHLLRGCKVLKLTKNMRLESPIDPTEKDSMRQFASEFLTLGTVRLVI
jgi:ATP-dependent DNA helicase PIF1